MVKGGGSLGGSFGVSSLSGPGGPGPWFGVDWLSGGWAGFVVVFDSSVKLYILNTYWRAGWMGLSSMCFAEQSCRVISVGM